MIGARYIVSATKLAELPRPDVDEIAFAGRSNVGKSTLLNLLAGVHGLARTSRTPGRTRLLNVFELDIVATDDSAAKRVIHFVDLPGYGFAAGPKADADGFAPMVEGYVEKRDTLRAVVCLFDARRDPDARDVGLIGWLRESRREPIAVITKADEIPANRRGGQWLRIAKGLGLERSELVITAAAEKIGREGVWARISSLL